MTDYATLARRPLALALAAAITLPMSAYAQTNGQDSNDEDDSSAELDKITVTGSRIKRSEVEGPAPVTVITSEQIEREGHVTVYDVLNTVTQSNGSTQNELFQSGFTPNASVINLRGLGPGRTLLLINGRRAADYPLPYNGQSNFANYGNIPTAAVDRIEILAGGASAIYGSDAVAGVVNVVLKTNFEGNQIGVRTGTSTEGGRDQLDVQWVGGKTSDIWSFTYAFQYYYSEPVFAYQRDFMDSQLDNPLPNEITGQQPTAMLRLQRAVGSTTDSYYDLGFANGLCNQFDDFVTWNFRSSTTGANLGTACGSFVDVGYQTISNRNSDLSAYLYGTLDFENGMQGWASFQGYSSDAESGGGTQFWGGPGTGPGTTWFDPQFNQVVSAQRVFTPQEVGGVDKLNSHHDEKSYDFAVGLRGTLADRFDWDATVGHARYETTAKQPRLVGALINDFYGVRSGTRPDGRPIYTLNLDRYTRPLTPQEFASLSTEVVTEGESKVSQASFVLSGDLFDLPAGPAGFAAVIEASSQEYDLNADPRVSPDVRQIYNLTGTGGGGERDRYATGIEFKFPVFESLTLNLAGRYDKYDDITSVDDASTWNAGLEWRPLDSLLIRGAYSTSFRAPDMHFVFAERSGAFSAVFDTYRCLATGRTATACGSTDPNLSYTAFSVRQGTQGLTEEEGESYTAGFVFDVTDDLSMSVDYYKIELEGVVADLTAAYILDSEAGCRTGLTRSRQPFEFAADSAFCQDILGRVSRGNPTGEQTIGAITEIRRGPINRAYQSVDGVDAAVSYRMDTDNWGDFAFQVAWSHTLSNEQAQFASDPRIDFRDDPGLFDFRSRVRSSMVWNGTEYYGSLFMLRQGSLPNWQETGRIAPFITWNGSFGKHITEDLNVALYVNNIFNRFHPQDGGFNTYPYFWRAFSPIGREISVQMEYSF